MLASTRFREHARLLAGRSLAEIFTYIYETNLWGSPETQSGLGSEMRATALIRSELPRLLAKHDVRTLLDAPCGDFSWMSQANLAHINYIGIDVVLSLIERNVARYWSPHRKFVRCDIVTDPLPKSDMILCRDCLVHLSYAEIHSALVNMRRSGASYLLATTFSEIDVNTDIRTGDWRPLNMCRPPFSLPEPIEVIVEDCAEERGAYSDKSLGLWRLAG